MDVNGLVAVGPPNAVTNPTLMPQPGQGLSINRRQQHISSHSPRPSMGGNSRAPSEGVPNHSVRSAGGSLLMALGNIRYPSFPPSLPGGRRRSNNNTVDMLQQQFLMDMEEAEPWQKEFIQFHRDETKGSKKSTRNSIGTGAGAGGRGSRESALPFIPSNESPLP